MHLRDKYKFTNNLWRKKTSKKFQAGNLFFPNNSSRPSKFRLILGRLRGGCEKEEEGGSGSGTGLLLFSLVFDSTLGTFFSSTGVTPLVGQLGLLIMTKLSRSWFFRSFAIFEDNLRCDRWSDTSVDWQHRIWCRSDSFWAEVKVILCSSRQGSGWTYLTYALIRDSLFVPVLDNCKGEMGDDIN